MYICFYACISSVYRYLTAFVQPRYVFIKTDLPLSATGLIVFPVWLYILSAFAKKHYIITEAHDLSFYMFVLVNWRLKFFFNRHVYKSWYVNHMFPYLSVLFHSADKIWLSFIFKSMAKNRITQTYKCPIEKRSKPHKCISS